MKKYDYILFDLDGTLTDPKIGITKGVNYALTKLGEKPETLEELEKFIGPPLHESFPLFYNYNKEKTEEAVSYFRGYFEDIGIFENSLYQGIEEVLKSLVNQGVKLYIATSKPEVFAKKIVEHFKLSSYFSGVYGSKLNGELSDKGKLIEFILTKEDIPKNSCLMVGDRKHDIIGAYKNGIDSLGVLYGYSKAEELRTTDATYIVRDIKDLREFFTMDIYA